MGKLKGGKYISGRAIERALKAEGWFISREAGNLLIERLERRIDRYLLAVGNNLTSRKKRILDEVAVNVSLPEEGKK